MSVPVRHHFLPQFYLRRWATEEEGQRVIGYTRPHKAVVVRAYPPAAIGYKDHLYAVRSRSDPARQQEVETGFMSPLDDKAAKALDFIEREKRRPDDPALASDWSRFVLRLLYGSPERLEWMRQKFLKIDQDALEDIRKVYDRQRKPADPPTYDEYRQQAGDSLTEETVAKFLKITIDNFNIGTHLNNMKWTMIHTPPNSRDLLTSDSPVMMSNGIGIADGFIMLPTGPTSMFVATNNVEVAQSFAAQTAKTFIRAMNDAIVRQADSLVIGSTRHHKLFVDKRLGRGGPSADEGFFRRMTWKPPI